MKKQYRSGAAVIVLLSALVLGGASAGIPGGASMLVSPDAQGKFTLWNVGPSGFLSNLYPGGSVDRLRTHATIWIPAGSTVEYVGPLAVPASIDGEKCKVKTVYVKWYAPFTCNISHVWITTGEVPLVDMAVNYPGTAMSQTITIDLVGDYAVPNGLTVAFDLHNSGSDNYIQIFGYGAKIKYKK